MYGPQGPAVCVLLGRRLQGLRPPRLGSRCSDLGFVDLQVLFSDFLWSRWGEALTWHPLARGMSFRPAPKKKRFFGVGQQQKAATGVAGGAPHEEALLVVSGSSKNVAGSVLGADGVARVEELSERGKGLMKAATVSAAHLVGDATHGAMHMAGAAKRGSSHMLGAATHGVMEGMAHLEKFRWIVRAEI